MGRASPITLRIAAACLALLAAAGPAADTTRGAEASAADSGTTGVPAVPAPAPASAGRPRLTISPPDIAPVVHRKCVLELRLDDPSRRARQVRVRIGGLTREPLRRDPHSDVATWGLAVTPPDGSPIPVLAEALDATGAVVARAVAWVTAAAPFEERVVVKPPPSWPDLLPESSTLRQRPLVLVHPLRTAAMTDEERRFGLNRRPARVVYLVDAGFGPETAGILAELRDAAAPARRLMRTIDRIGIVMLDQPLRVKSDFDDGWLARVVDGMAPPAGEPADFGAFLNALLGTAPEDATVALIFVTNGVEFGTHWKKKPLPGTRETDALLTPEEFTKIHALSFDRGIPLFALAVSTPSRPLLVDGKDRLDFAPLESRLEFEDRRTALRDGATPAAADREIRGHMARFRIYIRQMYDLLRTLSEGTQGGRRLRLARAGRIEEALRELLPGVVGRFQRRDFVVREGGGAACEEGVEQELEKAEYRARDKVIVSIALDESGSMQNEASAREALEAVTRLLPGLRLEDDCLMVSTFSEGLPAGEFECIQTLEQAQERILNRMRLGGATDIYGAAIHAARDMQDMETVVRMDPAHHDADVRKVLVLVTDGYQTVDDTNVLQATDTLRRLGVLVYEVIVSGYYMGGSIITGGGGSSAGWSSAVGGTVLPRPGIAGDATDHDPAALIESVYWGAREGYRLGYTSSSPEKDRRRVCIEIRDRPDLFVTRQGGDSYAADRPAAAHLLDAARNRSLSEERRGRSATALAEIGDIYDVPPLRRIVSSAEPGVRGVAAAALMRLAERIGMRPDQLDELLDDLPLSARTEMLDLIGRSPHPEDLATLAPATIELAALHELAAKAAKTGTDEARLAALIALGRLGPLSARATAAVTPFATSTNEMIALAAASLLKRSSDAGGRVG